jgi:RecB family endonuclease NucS
MRILIGRASARYSGRIEAELSAGDVVLLLRHPGDGSALLFDRAKGVQPRNWMPAGSVLVETLDRGRRSGQMVLEHPRGEKLEIFWHRIDQEIEAPGELGTELIKLGAEKEFSDLLAAKIDRVLPGLEAVAREYRTGVGPIDVLAWDPADRRPVVIEVKRRQITVSTAYQARRYVEALKKEGTYRKKAEVILVAPSIARGASEWIEAERGMRFHRLAFEDLEKI